MDDRPYRRPRSFFWPTMLMAVGIIWLLTNTGYIAAPNLSVLLRLWPILLIMLGLDILLARRWPLVGAALSLGMVGLIVYLVVQGPALGLATVPLNMSVNTRHDEYREPIGGATEARVHLSLGSAVTTISTSSDTPDLFAAQIDHIGDIDYRVTGTQQRMVSLQRANDAGEWFAGAFFDFRAVHWDIQLSERVPVDLDVTSGSGAATLELARLPLRSLNMTSGSGAIALTLPAAAQPYAVALSSGSGAVYVRLDSGANGTLQLDSGSGNVDVQVPQDAGVQLQVVNKGSGALNLPGGYKQLSSGARGTGTWQSPAFDSADRKIVITIQDIGSGNVTVR